MTFCLYLLLLLLAALEDIRSGYISDRWAALLAASGLFFAWDTPAFAARLLAILMTLSIYTALYMISRKSLGTGDILLAAGAAAWLTPVGALLALWLSAILALASLALPLLQGKASLTMEIRFAPFIALGGIITYGLETTIGLSALLERLPLT